MRGTPHIRVRGSPTTRGTRENAPEYDGHRRAGGILSPECGTGDVLFLEDIETDRELDFPLSCVISATERIDWEGEPR